MANSPDFIAHILELGRPQARMTARAMFGGHGIYADGSIVGIVVADTLYLKCDDESRGEYDALGLEPFVYTTKEGEGHAMSYRRAPEDALDAAPAFQPWLRKAQAASLRKVQAKRPRRVSPPRAKTK
jgi:DNA transformation protein